MKPFLLLSPLLLAACAPKAILLLDAGQSPPRKEPPATVATTPGPEIPAETPPSRPAADDLGLLEPRSLTEMPDEREMRPTVDPEDNRPVIATPPANEE